MEIVCWARVIFVELVSGFLVVLKWTGLLGVFCD